MIDFHCHIDLFQNPKEVLGTLEQRGCRVLAVTTTPAAWEGNVRLVGSTRGVRLAAGLHPELVATRHKEIDYLCELIHETDYIGEIGLDGSRPHKASLPKQIEVLNTIIAKCEQLDGRILSVHSRGASKQVLDLLDFRGRHSTPVLHWFTGTVKEVKRAVALGCWFSVGQAMLRSKTGSSLFSVIPRDRVLTESDGPFTKLWPWDTQNLFATFSHVWNCSIEEASAQVYENFKVLVGSDFDNDVLQLKNEA